LFSALGLAPLGCGAAFERGDGEGGSGGAAGRAGAPSGGKASGGMPSGGDTSGGSTMGGRAMGGGASLCEHPIDLGGGYEQCDDGTIHRPKTAKCPSSVPRPVAKLAAPSEGSCLSDADCTAAPHGFCSTATLVPTLFCQYGCVTDSECGAGKVCLCGEPVGQCVAATCTEDAECGAGLRCQSYDQSGGCGVRAFACQTPQDSCESDADCKGGFCGAISGPFRCSPGGCVVGRPFLVEGAERVAPVVSRSDWGASFVPHFADLRADEREHASGEWARIAQMEHASVAAFARFALQLLQLGAPAELVELSARAMADETRHARLAFGVAGALVGRPLGPGGLEIAHSLRETSLLDVVRLAVREGCIGETGAALEAREAALHARSPALATLLHGIAEDETRHAELAWRFVAWALEQDRDGVRGVVAAELSRAGRELTPSAYTRPSADELTLLGCGVVPERVRLALRNAAFAEVIEPCATALLARAPNLVAENPVLSA
jgi:hypothetical protein